ncbi:MAG: shikimate dehydrogenase [Lachnospiraceae bacterium]|nr:shikimate dehydrogenase [Lachnospiraceae bacterium]
MSARERQQFGVIGDPIGHTLSPVIHHSFGQTTGKELEYRPYLVKHEALGDTLRKMHASGIRGLNVTVPHKSAVIPFLTAIDPLAEKIGAVNTLVRDADGYRGYNTDVSGLKRALTEAGLQLAGAHVVILGAGGAGRAAAFLCAGEGAAEILILNRTREKAEALAEEVRGTMTGGSSAQVSVRAVDAASFIAGESAEDIRYLAIQCTSVGLYPHAEGSVITDPAFFRKLSAAVDIVYRPYLTGFLSLAYRAGVPIVSGLSMLLYQAADAFSLWYPEVSLGKGDLSRAMHALKAQALGFTGLCLTGFMGCGKTTVAETLAGILNFDLWDTDRMIEEASGKSVRAIFADEGEEVFRRLETATLKRIDEAVADPWEGETDGVIISTGGGVPVREENRKLLKDGHVVTVWLRVRPETVMERLAGDATRPLLAGSEEEKRQRITALMRERESFYEECATCVVDTDGRTPAEIAAAILIRLCGSQARQGERV